MNNTTPPPVMISVKEFLEFMKQNSAQFSTPTSNGESSRSTQINTRRDRK